MRRLALLLLLAAAACQQKIQHGLDESQANEIEALLSEAGIVAQKVREGGREARWAIEVDSEQAPAAIKLLSDHDLPRQRAPGFAEVFGQGSMVPTPTEENALFVHALAGEISRTLAELDGVVHARVHLVSSPSAPGALRAPPSPRASVLLKVRRGAAQRLEPRRAEIQALVAGSAQDLRPEDVAVMFAELPPPPSLAAGSPGASPPRLATALLAALSALLSAGLAGGTVYARRLRLRLEAAQAPAGAIAPAPDSAPPPREVRRAA